jgi:hypothetical protein
MIKWNKVFRAGTHKGKTYRNDDLRATATAYSNTHVTAPWTIGHEIYPGDPAAGWIRTIEYREDGAGIGELWAETQFTKLGLKILDDETHQNRSISFYPPDSNYNPHPGVNFVRHVAMLGAEMPALTDLGLTSLVDFSEGDISDEEILTYSILDKPMDIEKKLQELADQIAALSKLITAEVALEDSITDVAPDTNAGETPCASCAPSAPEYSTEEPSSEPVDYKALYEKAIQANASVGIAQEVDLLYSDGILSEAEIPAKDLIEVLTKIKLRPEDFGAETGEVFTKLLEALKVRTPQVDLGSAFEENDFSADIEHPLEEAEPGLADDYNLKVEKVAREHELSYSQALSAHVSAEAFVASNPKNTYQKALTAEVKRFKR